MVDFKAGDIFTIPLPNQKYIFGRILLDVNQQCLKSKLINADSPLIFYDGTLLVEIYKELSDKPNFAGKEKLIPGFFLITDPIKDKEWPIIDNIDINPEDVEFPETLCLYNGRQFFQKGEVCIPTPEYLKQEDGWDIYPALRSPYALPKICLYHLGLKEFLTSAQQNTMNLVNFDFNFSKLRREIYNKIKENENESYYKMSLRLGHDIRRFYSNIK